MLLKYFLIRGYDGSMKGRLRLRRMSKNVEYDRGHIVDALCYVLKLKRMLFYKGESAESAAA